MKFLVVLCSVVACALAEPGVLGHAAYAAPAIASYAAPAAYAAPAIASYAAPAAIAAPAVTSYAAPAIAAPAVAAYAAPAAVAAPAAIAAPAHVAYAAAAPAVAVGVRTQYHAQDELGQASYGHAEPLQTHNAVQDAHGNKIGSYSYVAPSGQVIRTDYVADALGYRVASNALPVGPSAPVVDTPEVLAARAVHLHEVAKIRGKRGIAAVGHTPAATAPLGVAHGVAAYAAPAAIAAPAVAAYAAPAAVAVGHTPAATAPLAAPVAHAAVAAPVAYAAPAAVAVGHTPAATAPLGVAHGVAAYAAPAVAAHGVAAYAAPAVAAHGVAAYAAPAVAAHGVAVAPAVRSAVLSTVVNTPGHAVSYRVY